MARIDRITSTDAAERKGCTRQNIAYAIRKGKIDAEQIGPNYIVLVNRKFEEWAPNPKIQAIRRKKPAKKAKRAKK